MQFTISLNLKMEITEADIKRVEEIFFNGKGSFEDEKGERYAFISNINQSIDVEACPGSGKTTCLLAKLYLLSEKMPFENESIGAVVMINVFHHIPDCTLFLAEAMRVLPVGGKIIMVEPYNSTWSRFINGKQR